MKESPHLTTEQMHDLLAPNSAPAGDSHLTACPACRSELSTLRHAVATFRAAATGFAVAEAPPLAPRCVIPAQSNVFRRHAWAASFATAIVLSAVSISLIHPRRQVVVPVGSAFATRNNGGSAESDAALLDSIQRDLSTSIPPSLEPLAVPAASGATDRRN